MILSKTTTLQLNKVHIHYQIQKAIFCLFSFRVKATACSFFRSDDAVTIICLLLYTSSVHVPIFKVAVSENVPWLQATSHKILKTNL